MLQLPYIAVNKIYIDKFIDKMKIIYWMLVTAIAVVSPLIQISIKVHPSTMLNIRFQRNLLPLFKQNTNLSLRVGKKRNKKTIL